MPHNKALAGSLLKAVGDIQNMFFLLLSCGQTALKNAICTIVHHAGRIRAYSPIMVSRFELSSGTINMRAAPVVAAMHLTGAHKL